MPAHTITPTPTSTLDVQTSPKTAPNALHAAQSQNLYDALDHLGVSLEQAREVLWLLATRETPDHYPTLMVIYDLLEKASQLAADSIQHAHHLEGAQS